MNLPSTRQTFPITNFPTGQSGGVSSALGTIQTWSMDQTFPTEALVVRAYFAINGTALTSPATPTNIFQLDWLRSLVQSFQISVQDTGKTVYQMSGAAALEYAWLSGFNLAPSTMALLQNTPGTTNIAANSQYVLEYLIPLVPQNAGEDLRTLMLLPTHLYDNPAQLTITFGQPGNLGTGGSIAYLNVDVVRYGRRMTKKVEDLIASKFGGYIQSDILEATYNPSNATTAQNVPLSIPGWYWNLFARHYLGGTSYSRACLDQAGIGGGAASTSGSVTTLAGGFGSENLWTINWGQNVYQQFKWKDLYAMPRYKHALNSNTQSSSPDVAGNVIASSNFPSASSCFIDFAGDGFSFDEVTELGSLFDTVTPNAQKQAVYITGQFSAPGTNASVLSYGGQRLLVSNNITQFQMFGGQPT